MRSHRESAPIIGVLGGCGGAGATSLAAVIAARGAAEEVWPVLIDLDPLGGGIDVALGEETAPGPRWSGLHATGGRLDPEQLAEGLPRWGEVPFLACDGAEPPDDEAVRSVLTAASAIGPVVVDLGRFRSGARIAALGSADAVVLLVPADVRSIAASSRVRAAAERDLGGTWLLTVRTHDRSVVGPDWAAELLGLPLAGVLGPDPGLQAGRDRGIDATRLRRRTVATARSLLEQALAASMRLDRVAPDPGADGTVAA